MQQLELFKWEQVVHGTKYMYDKRGCRCDSCREAATAYSRHHKKGALCSRCGEKTWLTRSSADQIVCHLCRKSAPNPHPDRKSFPCVQCGAEAGYYYKRPTGKWSWRPRKFCSTVCRNAGLTSTAYAKPYYRRSEVVPGMRAAARAKLLAKWRRQGRACFYCDGPVDSVDHVIPLVRGGTNFEGNLVPCCLPCNGSKSGSLLMEWRLRRGAIKAAA